jgi:hypothetical protein
MNVEKSSTSLCIRFDDALARFERVLLVFSVVMMTALSFLSVLHRIFSRQPGRCAQWLFQNFSVPVESIWGDTLFWSLMFSVLFVIFRIR